jgi:hypothetical protein
MQGTSRFFRGAVIASFFLLLVGLSTTVQAQERMTIQATAMGTSTQMGKMFNVNIHIEQFSTPDDKKALVEAFTRSGQDGLVDVLEHMKPKGRIRTPWGVGNDVEYIIELPSENGRRFRLVTNRRIAFGESRQGTRSRDYSVGAVELILTPDGKGSGTLLPACKLTVNKKNQQIEIETYQNPWNLTNLMISKD